MKAAALLLLVSTCPLAAQFDSIAYGIAQSIRAEALKEHVFSLAAADMEGRETGTAGNLKAAAYIAGQFNSFGIPANAAGASFYQEVAFSTFKWQSISMSVGDEPAQHLKDYICMPQFFPGSIEGIDIVSMMFLGYGIDDPVYSDYKGKNVKGKHLLVYAGEPREENGISRITRTDQVSSWSTNPDAKLKTAREAGAASIWIIDERFREKAMAARRSVMGGDLQMGSPEDISREFIPNFLVSSTFGQRLIGSKVDKVIKLRDKITRKGKPFSTIIPVAISWKGEQDIQSIPGVNVLGYIEGTDPMLKKEIVVVTAHYDHLGKRGEDIFFGADDNASGTSAVIEIARALSKAKTMGIGPKRSVLCMLVTGEEKGLLGSQYYTEHPVFALERTVANVNIDMIGRVDTKHPHPLYTYVIGSDRLSTELHEINETANQTYTKLELDYTYNLDSDPNRFYYRSDHYNFAMKGIPAIFYFSGVHEDYHRPTDTPDKIMFDKAEIIAKLAFHTTWELANRKDRIKVNVTGRS